MSQGKPFNPLPACPIPIQYDVEARKTELQTIIDNASTGTAQKTNLRAAIDLYDRGVLPGSYRFIQDGEVVGLQDLDCQRDWWTEAWTFLFFSITRYKIHVVGMLLIDVSRDLPAKGGQHGRCLSHPVL